MIDPHSNAEITKHQEEAMQEPSSPRELLLLPHRQGVILPRPDQNDFGLTCRDSTASPTPVQLDSSVDVASLATSPYMESNNDSDFSWDLVGDSDTEMSEHDVDALELKHLSIDESVLTTKLEGHGDEHRVDDRMMDGQHDELETNWVILGTTDAKTNQPVSSPSFQRRSVDRSAAPLTMEQRIELVRVHEQERLAKLANKFGSEFDRHYPPCHFSSIKARSRFKRQMMEKELGQLQHEKEYMLSSRWNGKNKVCAV